MRKFDRTPEPICYFDSGLGWATVEYQKYEASDPAEDDRTRVLSDVVILVFCATNDISDTLANHADYKHSKPTPYFEIENGVLVLLDSEGKPLDYDSYSRPHETSSGKIRSHLTDFVRHQLSGLNAGPAVSLAELGER